MISGFQSFHDAMKRLVRSILLIKKIILNYPIHNPDLVLFICEINLFLFTTRGYGIRSKFSKVAQEASKMILS